MAVNQDGIKRQSLSAYNQWKDVWRENAKHHSKYNHKSMADFANRGVGRACLSVANGYSLELEMETIKKYQKNVDILCCDKTLGHLLDNGISPTFCIVCDAMVDYEKYMEKYKDQLQDTILIMNACANTKWSDNGNWKEKYFFVNHDCLRSEIEFCKLSGCRNTIPAGTNVSNAMVVLLTQCQNTGRNNFFGYDKILLIGYDYSWYYGGKYYAYDENGGGKAHYMRHAYVMNLAGDNAYSSSNLLFSAGWLEKYINTFKLPIVQCSQHSVLKIPYNAGLKSQMQYRFRPEDKTKVVELLYERDKIRKQVKNIESNITKIGLEHYYSFLGSI